MDPGDMELNGQRGPDEGKAGPLKQLAPATKGNDKRVRKATLLFYKYGQMKTFKQPISTVVLLVYLFLLFIYLLIYSLTKTLCNMNKSC